MWFIATFMRRVNLFVYGTLQVPEVMRRICQRVPVSEPATLHDYACFQLRGKVYPAILPVTGASTKGLLYLGLNPTELARLDHYEGHWYERISVQVSFGRGKAVAETYVLKRNLSRFLSATPWSLSFFRARHLREYLRRL